MITMFDNPDPNIEPPIPSIVNGVCSFMNGKLRSRYEILKDANASEELQIEMSRVTATLWFAGVMFGIAISALAVITFFLIGMIFYG